MGYSVALRTCFIHASLASVVRSMLRGVDGAKAGNARPSTPGFSAKATNAWRSSPHAAAPVAPPKSGKRTAQVEFCFVKSWTSPAASARERHPGYALKDHLGFVRFSQRKHAPRFVPVNRYTDEKPRFATDIANNPDLAPGAAPIHQVTSLVPAQFHGIPQRTAVFRAVGRILRPVPFKFPPRKTAACKANTPLTGGQL